MNTPEYEFFQACNQNREELARSILKSYPNLDVSHHGAIHWAAVFQRTRMIDFLLTLEVRLDTFSLESSTPLLLVMKNFDDEDVKLKYMKKLLQAGAPADLGKSDGESPLWEANSADTVRLLIQYGANINTISPKNQWSLLMCYCDKLNLELVKLLVENPEFVLINHQAQHGYTALIVAIEREFTEAIKLLIQYGADYHLPSPSGRPIFDISSIRVQAVLEKAIRKRNSTVGASAVRVISPHSVVTLNEKSKEGVATLPPPSSSVQTRRSIFNFFSRKDASAPPLPDTDEQSKSELEREKLRANAGVSVHSTIPTAQAEFVSQQSSVSREKNIAFTITIEDWNNLQKRLESLEGIVTQQTKKLDEQAKDIHDLKQSLS